MRPEVAFPKRSKMALIPGSVPACKYQHRARLPASVAKLAKESQRLFSCHPSALERVVPFWTMVEKIVREQEQPFC